MRYVWKLTIQTGVVAIIVSRTFNLRKIHQITRCNRIIVEFTMHCKLRCPIKFFHFTVFQMIDFEIIYIGTMVIQLNIYFSKFLIVHQYVQEYTSSQSHNTISKGQEDKKFQDTTTKENIIIGGKGIKLLLDMLYRLTVYDLGVYQG